MKDNLPKLNPNVCRKLTVVPCHILIHTVLTFSCPPWTLLMNSSVPSVLLGLGGKCLLSWALIFLQRRHIFGSFLGVFTISLAAVDTALALSFTAVNILCDGSGWLQGLRINRYHICLLVQILGRICDVLHWPTVAFAGLDHLLTVTQRVWASSARARRLAYLLVASLHWCLAIFYVFLWSDFIPVMEDVSPHQIHQCWVTQTSQVLYIVAFLLLTLGCFALDSWCRTKAFKSALLQEQIASRGGGHSRRHLIHQAIETFFTKWIPFLLLVVVLQLLPVGMPAYLSMNAAWICFLNSFLIAVVVCGVCPAKDFVCLPPDSFCEWRIEQNCTW